MIFFGFVKAKNQHTRAKLERGGALVAREPIPRFDNNWNVNNKLVKAYLFIFLENAASPLMGGTT